jgi:hypothetical protein
VNQGSGWLFWLDWLGMQGSNFRRGMGTQMDDTSKRLLRCLGSRKWTIQSQIVMLILSLIQGVALLLLVDRPRLLIHWSDSMARGAIKTPTGFRPRPGPKPSHPTRLTSLAPGILNMDLLAV